MRSCLGGGNLPDRVLPEVRAQGKRLGRPPVASEVEERIRARLAEGLGMQKVASMEGVGVSVVQRVKAEFLSGAS